MQKGIRYSYLIILTYLTRHGKKLIFSVILGFIMTVFFTSNLTDLIPTKNKYRRIGISGSYQINNIPPEIKEKVTRSLFTINENGTAENNLAETITSANEGREYTIKVFENISWQDGSPFKAGDIKLDIKGATFTVIDDYTLRITLEDRYSPLSILLSVPLLKDKIIGLGDYKITKIQFEGESLSEVILKNIKGDKNNLITYRIYRNEDQLISAFKLGKIDRIENITEISNLKNWPDLNIEESTNYTKVFVLYFNLDKDIFKNKELRKAVAASLPEFNNQTKSTGPLSPLNWAYSSNIKTLVRDPEKGSAVFKEIKENMTDPVELTVFPENYALAEVIAKSLEDAGLPVKLQVIRSFKNDFDMFVSLQSVPQDPDQYYLWHSTQNTNITKYKSQKIDKLLEDGRKTESLEDRKKIYYDFQRYLNEDLPAIYLYYPKKYNIARN